MKYEAFILLLRKANHAITYKTWLAITRDRMDLIGTVCAPVPEEFRYLQPLSLAESLLNNVINLMENRTVQHVSAARVCPLILFILNNKANMSHLDMKNEGCLKRC